ncbi:MAG: DUF4386 domain-containing protein [Saprospiraceae bacterium]|nr:DUF4386 domain-containing protein [Saprospiraceae bacterium]
MSSRKAAVVAGVGLLIMTISWLLSDFFVFQRLIESEDATLTANNIREYSTQFRLGILALLIVLLCDLVVAWALYVFLKPINQNLSLLAAWGRLVYSILLGIALLNYLDVLQLLSNANYLKIFDTNQLNADVMLSIDAFYNDWNFALVFFGFHLVLLGYLAFKSNYIPKFIAILLALAGISYLIDYLGKILFPDFEATVSLLLGWGELIFMFWLLIKGRKI